MEDGERQDADYNNVFPLPPICRYLEAVALCQGICAEYWMVGSVYRSFNSLQSLVRARRTFPIQQTT